MKNVENKNAQGDKDKRPRVQVRLPGFVTDEVIGLGDVLKQVTYAVGIKPCGGCERRAAALNRWLGFSGSRPK